MKHPKFFRRTKAAHAYLVKRLGRHRAPHQKTLKLFGSPEFHESGYVPEGFPVRRKVPGVLGRAFLRSDLDAWVERRLKADELERKERRQREAGRQAERRAAGRSGALKGYWGDS